MAYKRIVLTEKDSMLKESVDFSTQTKNNQISRQMSKFDNSYTSKKLNELYHEFDSITFTAPSIAENMTMLDDVAVATRAKVGYKTKLYLSSAIIVTALLLFLAIFNIFVINNLNAGIKLLQEEVTSSANNYNSVYDEYNALKNVDNISNTIKQNGYGEISSDSVIKITPLERKTVETITSSTNWFDEFCNFVAGLFGG